jgi:hypothetical protein
LKKKCEHKHHHKHHHHKHHHKHEHEVIPPVPPTPPTELKWRCSGEPEYICTQAVNGIYDTEQECIDACFAPRAPPPDLGTALNFRVLAHETITNTIVIGGTTIDGNLGLTPGTSVTGFPPGVVTGGQFIGPLNAIANQAQADLTTAWNQITATPFTVDLTGQDLGGMTLPPGVYNYDNSAGLTGDLILDAGGNSAAVWIFQIGSTLTTAANSTVTVTNGGLIDNVFWQVRSSATLGIDSQIAGNVLAQDSITVTTGAVINGRALARTAAVTLDENTVGP